MAISGAGLVLLTVAYTAQFDFPLTSFEVYQRLLGIALEQAEVERSLRALASWGLIKERDGRWGLKTELGADGLIVKNIFQLRQERERLFEARWQEIERLKKLIGWLPWIEGIAITGSFAMKNAGANSDLDLMVVTAHQRLWVTRFLVAMLVWAAGRRRNWHGGEAGTWCFNLWLEVDNLRLPPHKQTIYSAYEVCQTRWIVDKKDLQQKFYQYNSWVKQFLPNYYQICTKIKNSQSQEQITFITPELWLQFKSFLCRQNQLWIFKILGWGLFKLSLIGGDFINYLFYLTQLTYMYPHMTRETVSLSAAYFHPRSTKNIIYQRWLQSLLELKT